MFTVPPLILDIWLTTKPVLLNLAPIVPLEFLKSKVLPYIWIGLFAYTSFSKMAKERKYTFDKLRTSIVLDYDKCPPKDFGRAFNAGSYPYAGKHST